MSVIRRSNTPPEDGRQPSRRFQGTYEEYLQTPHWRRIRNAALSRAGWTCNRCPAQRTLQVHHRTYERLGCEFPADLEVLCQTCHEGHHVDEQRQIRGIYARVVSACLAEERFKTMADLTEAVKVKCAQAKIAYDGSKVWRAIRLVDANRSGVLDAPKPFKPQERAPSEQDRPLQEWEAKRLLGDLGGIVRTMPAVERVSALDYRKMLAMRQVEALMLESLRRCEELEKAIT